MSLYADAFPPPIPVLDFVWLGLPLGLVAGVSAIGGAIFVVAQLRKRKVRTGLALLAGGLLFLLADCGAYVMAIQRHGEQRRARYLERERERPARDPAELADGGRGP